MERLLIFAQETDWYIWCLILISVVVPYIVLFRTLSDNRRKEEELRELRKLVIKGRADRRKVSNQIKKQL